MPHSILLSSKVLHRFSRVMQSGSVSCSVNWLGWFWRLLWKRHYVLNTLNKNDINVTKQYSFCTVAIGDQSICSNSRSFLAGFLLQSCKYNFISVTDRYETKEVTLKKRVHLYHDNYILYVLAYNKCNAIHYEISPKMYLVRSKMTLVNTTTEI